MAQIKPSRLTPRRITGIVLTGVLLIVVGFNTHWVVTVIGGLVVLEGCGRVVALRDSLRGE